MWVTCNRLSCSLSRRSPAAWSKIRACSGYLLSSSHCCTSLTLCPHGQHSEAQEVPIVMAVCTTLRGQCGPSATDEKSD